ncbi:MAG: UDP-glucose 6-dehydrogenase [Candidatus Marinimicrobia bacterium]|nr:UDP-glucose 6-dehydrogenase [Candidatus Neomarinimicrobiota bacterium]|tara:strand:+ start:1147 stop:2463 length:1317 start_codon:yes stop_codon:yes gene_type:complete
MKVVMVGTGYVGLVSGACFSEFGAKVTCVDKDIDKIESLNQGHIPIYEPGLDEIVKRNLASGRLVFTSDLSNAAQEADLIFIAVGTPSRRGDGHADLKYVYSAAEEIANNINGYTVIVNKSTVPVGTAKKVKDIIKNVNPDLDFDIASNPEFLREGSAIEDFMRPDRVIIGLESKKAEELLKSLYRPLNLIETPILFTDLESAELIKYASNAFLATKISFINELSMLSEKAGSDIHAVAKGMGLDRRIGSQFLNVGPGYGGSCFPKDTLALIQTFEDFDLDNRIVKSVVDTNNFQKERMIEKIVRSLEGGIAGKVIAVLGLTFKPETDDMRDSPSLTILPALIEKEAKIRAHDPEGVDQAKKLLPDAIEYVSDIYETAKNADAIILMTEWNQYRGLDLELLKRKLKGRVFIDLRNVYEPDEMNESGFQYYCIGRGQNI